LIHYYIKLIKFFIIKYNFYRLFIRVMEIFVDGCLFVGADFSNEIVLGFSRIKI
jgi:hypothetical protein